MASKKKNKRAVLVTSCILAALIVAGSTFAWFTSTDDVTNRLTASADYGVSIVESFAPPANWLPGQIVNKDVYAVNTGTIAAFVKETVSGKLQYTYEMKVNQFDANNCLELTSTQITDIDGVTTNEGGGFLAWTDAKDSSGNPVNTGAVNSARLADGIANAWKPTYQGTYIFRRSIVRDSAAPTDETKNKFTYAGYYFVPADPNNANDHDHYYKIVIGDDPYRTDAAAGTGTNGNANSVVFDIVVNSEVISNDVTINTADGSFTGSPKIAYVKNSEQYANVSFKYEDNGSKPRLKVEYAVQGQMHTIPADPTNPSSVAVTYDATAWAAQKEVLNYNAQGEYNKATVLYEQAKADNEYAAALAQARDILLAAAKTRKAAHDAVYANTSGTEDVKTAKWTALQNVIGKGNPADASSMIAKYNVQKSTLVNTYKVDDLFNGTQLAKIGRGSIRGTVSGLSSCKANIDRMDQLMGDIQQLDANLWAELSPIVTLPSDVPAQQPNPDEVEGHLNKAKNYLDQLVAKLRDYSNTFSEIVDNADTASTLGLDPAETHAAKTAINGIADAVGNLKDSADGAFTEYQTAYNEQVDKAQNDQAAAAVWTEALNNYNNAVGTAQNNYLAVVNKGTPTQQPASQASYSNNSETIVPYYSMKRVAAASDPAITVPNDPDEIFEAIAAQTYGNGTTDATPPNANANPATPGDPEWKSETKKVHDDEDTLKTNWEDKAAAASSAKQIYDDAKADADGSSKITMYVNLDPQYATYWQRNEATDGSTDVEFYLKSILEGGKTSGKLIDSVEFDNTVEAKDFKNLTFDLNVGLKSAQITYADDQVTITTEAVTKPDFNMKPTVTNNTTVTWAQ